MRYSEMLSRMLKVEERQYDRDKAIHETIQRLILSNQSLQSQVNTCRLEIEAMKNERNQYDNQHGFTD